MSGLCWCQVVNKLFIITLTLSSSIFIFDILSNPSLVQTCYLLLGNSKSASLRDSEYTYSLKWFVIVKNVFEYVKK